MLSIHFSNATVFSSLQFDMGDVLIGDQTAGETVLKIILR